MFIIYVLLYFAHSAATKAGNDLKIEENSNGDAENYDEVENNQGEEDSFIIGGR